MDALIAHPFHSTLKDFFMITMFTRFFAMLTAYFIALEKVGNGAVHIGTWVEEGAGAMADEARIKRQAGMNLMLKEQKVTEKQLAAVTK